MKIAVVADPQLMDSTSLGLPPSSIALQAAEFYTDLNMRRSFQSVVLPFKPDMLLFLGITLMGAHICPMKSGMNRCLALSIYSA